MPFLSTVKRVCLLHGNIVCDAFLEMRSWGSGGFHDGPKVQNRNGTRRIPFLVCQHPQQWSASWLEGNITQKVTCSFTLAPRLQRYIYIQNEHLLIPSHRLSWQRGCWARELLLSRLVPTHSSGQFCSMKNVGESITTGLVYFD